MKGEKYLDVLRASIKAIEHWKEHGNAIIADCGAKGFMQVIEESMNKLSQLDADEVKDEILEREDGIAWKIKRINKYGLLPLLEYIEGNKNYTADLNDDAVNDAVNKYWDMVYFKADELCRAMTIAERYLPSPKHPLIEKALESQDLLSYFRGDKRELERYVTYCIKEAKNPTQMAKRAVYLWDEEEVIDYNNIIVNLHEALQGIGLKVGEYNNWRQAVTKARTKIGR